MWPPKESFFLIGVLFISIVHCHQLSDKRKCADPKCEVLISTGKTVNQYNAPSEGLLSFRKDVDVNVYSKDAGSNDALWGVEIGGRRGYANKKFIKEMRIHVKDDLVKYEVPTRQIMTLETDNVSGDEEGGEEQDDEPDEEEEDGSPSDDDEDGQEFNGSEIFDDAGKEGVPDAVNLSTPPTQFNDDTASQSVDNDGIFKNSVSDTNPSESADGIASSAPTAAYDVVDGTTIYDDDDASVVPQYLAPTETPPPLPPVTQTVPPPSASQYLPSDAGSDSTPDLEVVPSGESREYLNPSEIVPDIVMSAAEGTTVSPNVVEPHTAEGSTASPDMVEPHASSVPPLLSTLSGPVSDDSQVHATTTSVEEQALESSHVAASVNSEGFMNTAEGEPNAPSTVEDKQIEPSAVEQESSGILSSIASSFANMFEIPDTDEGSEETAPENEEKPVDDTAKDKIEAEEEKNSDIAQSNPDSFTASPKEEDIINVEPNSEINKETGDSSAVAGEAEQEVPVTNPSELDERRDNEQKSPEPDNNDSNDVESAEMPSSLPSLEAAQALLENVETHVVQDSDLANLEGSDPANPEVSNSANVEESEHSNVAGSDPSDGEISDKAYVDMAAVTNVEESDHSAVEDSDSLNVDGSDAANTEGSSVADSEEPASLQVESPNLDVPQGDVGSVTAADPNAENLPAQETFDVNGNHDAQSSDSSKHSSIFLDQKFITNIMDDHTDTNPVESVAAEPIASVNDQDTVHPPPETTTLPPEQLADENSVDEVTSDRSSDADILPESIFSDGGTEGEVAPPSSGEESASHVDHQHAIAGSEDQSLNTAEEENQGSSGSDKKEQAADGLDLHDSDTIAGKLMQVAEPILGDSLSLALESEVSEAHMSSTTFISLLLVAFAFIVVLLYSVHALLMKCSREGPLLEALNAMEHEQHVAAAVIVQLQERLITFTSGSPGETTIVQDTAAVDRLTQELQVLQEETTNRATRIQELEQELEESTSSGLEMHAMLQDLLHEQRDTAGFQDSVDHLQKMLDSQREKVESLTADLSIKTTMNDELKLETKSSREKISKLEYQLEQVTHSLDEASSSKDRVQAQLTEEQSRSHALTGQMKELTQSYEQASTALADLQTKHKAAEQKTERLQKMLRTKETELHVTKECLKQLKLFNEGKGSKEKLTQMLDVIKVQAQLSSAQQECTALQQQLQQKAEEVSSQEQAAREAKAEATRCLDLHQQANNERNDALSKLAVLTSYFQEKEAQLTKELESESGLRHNAEGSAETVSSRIRDYDMQLLACKTQVEGLKKELDDQEQSYRAQVAAQEQKAHESWVAARAAERKLDESKQETSQLRSRLLLASKEGADNHAIVKPTPKHAEVSNGSLSSPRPPLHDDLDGEHSLPLNPMDPPPPIPPPHMLFPPPLGGPPLPHGMPPFPPPPPGMHPPGMPGMHPPHPFLPPPPLPPSRMSDHRLPPAGRLASPSFHRRSPPDYLDRHGAPSPPFDQRRSPAHYDRRSYSPSSEHSRYSDRPGHYSPDRHSERQYADSRHHNDRYHHNNGDQRYSPDRWLNRSPDGYARKPSPPRRLYDDQHRKGKKTSTPLGPNDR